jgi:hypothetical protein
MTRGEGPEDTVDRARGSTRLRAGPRRHSGQVGGQRRLESMGSPVARVLELEPVGVEELPGHPPLQLAGPDVPRPLMPRAPPPP